MRFSDVEQVWSSIPKVVGSNPTYGCTSVVLWLLASYFQYIPVLPPPATFLLNALHFISFLCVMSINIAVFVFTVPKCLKGFS